MSDFYNSPFGFEYLDIAIKHSLWQHCYTSKGRRRHALSLLHNLFHNLYLPGLTAEEKKPPTLLTIRRASCFHVDLLLQPFRSSTSDTVHLTASHTPAQEHATSRNKNSWKTPSPRPCCGLTTHLARAREPEALIAPTLALHCSKLTGMFFQRQVPERKGHTLQHTPPPPPPPPRSRWGVAHATFCRTAK